MFEFIWGISKPSYEQYDSIENEDYEYVAKLSVDCTAVIDKESLLKSLHLEKPGILRLLLDHPSADPNLILIDALDNDMYSHVIALLECPRIKFDHEGVDIVIASACRKGLVEIVSIMLNYPSLENKQELSYVYLNEAIKSQNINLIRLMLKDKRFDTRRMNYICIVTACQYATEEGCNILRLILSNPLLEPSKLCETPLLETLYKKNRKGFNLIMLTCKDKQVSLHRTVVDLCLDSQMATFFDILIQYFVGDTALRNVVDMCIERDKAARLASLVGVGKVFLQAKHIVKAIQFRSTKCIAYMIGAGVVACSSIPSKDYLKVDCDNACGAKEAIKKHEDDIAMMIIKSCKCNHGTLLAKIALDNHCYKSMEELLLEDRVHITEDLAGKIILSDHEGIVNAMVTKVIDIKQEYVLEALKQEMYRIVTILRDAKLIDIAWNNYSLLRHAANDRSSRSFKSLLNDYTIESAEDFEAL